MGANMGGDVAGGDQPEEQGTQGEGTTPEEQAKQRIPEFESAINRQSASFVQWAEARFGSSKAFNPDRVNRLINERYRPKLLKAFEAEHGGVSAVYWCENVKAGAVLTKEAKLYVINPLGQTSQVDELIYHVHKVNDAARLILGGQDLKICIDRLYGVTTHALAILDAQAGPNPPDFKGVFSTLELLGNEIDQIDRSRKGAAQRKAQIDYFLGMLGGISALAGATLLFILVSALLELPLSSVNPLAASLVAGGAGAVVSVMSRMHGGKLQLRYKAGSRLIGLLGAFRPVIGSIMGVALLILIVSGLLPVVVPSDAGVRLYFFAGVAFLAGFSERFAQDMLAKSKERLGTATGAGE